MSLSGDCPFVVCIKALELWSSVYQVLLLVLMGPPVGFRAWAGNGISGISGWLFPR